MRRREMLMQSRRLMVPGQRAVGLLSSGWPFPSSSSSSSSSSSIPAPLIPEFARKERVDVLDYALPAHRIALHPVSPRSSSRMLIARSTTRSSSSDDDDGGGAGAGDGAGDAPPPTSLLTLRDGAFRDISEELPKDALLVVNDTRVVAARLFLRRRGGDGPACEVLCVAPRAEREDEDDDDDDDGSGGGKGRAGWFSPLCSGAGGSVASAAGDDRRGALAVHDSREESSSRRRVGGGASARSGGL